MNKILYILIVSFAFSLSVNAQNENSAVKAEKKTSASYPKYAWNLDYSMSFGIGDINDFIENPSFRGFHIDGRYFLNEKLSIGGGLSWNVYNQSFQRATYDFEGGAITGKKWNYFFNMPLVVNTHYYFTHTGFVQPRIGISTGGYYTEYEVQIGNYALVDRSWKFGVTPEVELYIPIAFSEWGFHISGRYNYVFYDANNINGFQNITLDVGFTYTPF